jgi:RNA-directed DNA polymerase
VGAVVSPILANLFMHYAFDSWMARNFPGCPFERYADDAVVQCKSRRQAEDVLGWIAARMAEVGLRLHPDKTRIVYCKDGRRRAEHEHTSFTFLGYAFRARGARSKNGVNFTGFLPAISSEALKAKGAWLRGLRIHRRTDLSLDGLARWLNPIIAGWIRYYRRFYRTALDPLLKHVNTYLKRWAGRNTNDYGPTNASAGGGPGSSQENPACSPTGASSAPTADQKSPVTGDCHAGI